MNDLIKLRIIYAIQEQMYQKGFIDLSFKEVMRVMNHIFFQYCNIGLAMPSEDDIKKDVDVYLQKTAIAIPKSFLHSYEYKKEIFDFLLKYQQKQMGVINE